MRVCLVPPELGSVSLLGWSPPGHVQQVELNLTHGSLRPHEDCMKIAPQEVLPSETLCVQPVEPLLERCPVSGALTRTRIPTRT